MSRTIYYEPEPGIRLEVEFDYWPGQEWSFEEPGFDAEAEILRITLIRGQDQDLTECLADPLLKRIEALCKLSVEFPEDFGNH